MVYGPHTNISCRNVLKKTKLLTHWAQKTLQQVQLNLNQESRRAENDHFISPFSVWIINHNTANLTALHISGQRGGRPSASTGWTEEREEGRSSVCEEGLVLSVRLRPCFKPLFFWSSFTCRTDSLSQTQISPETRAAHVTLFLFSVQPVSQQLCSAVTLHQSSITNDNVTRPTQHRRSLLPRVLASVR